MKITNKLIHKKGYLLKVSSYEGDGDASNNIELSFDDFEKAKAYFKIADTLYDIIGGSTSHRYCFNKVVNYFKNDEYFKNHIPSEPDDIFRYALNIDFELTGNSYDQQVLFRAIDGVELFEIPEDIYLNKIEL